MPTRCKTSALCWGAAAFAAAFVFIAAAHGAPVGPFSMLSGNWSGAGKLTLGGGTDERIRCRASYNVQSEGSSMQLQLRCASDSYNFELRSNVIYRDGSVQGDWNETTRSVAGRVEGSVNGNHFNLRVDSQSFAALLSLVTNGGSQTITIEGPPGAEMRRASISLSRGG